MDKNVIIEAVLSGVPAVNLISSEHLRVDELIASVATNLKFEVREWNQGSGWVDFKNKRPFQDAKRNVSIFEDLKQLYDLDYKANNTCIVIKNADTALSESRQATAKIQHQLLRIQRHFRMQAFVILCSGSPLDLPELNGLYISHVYEPPLNEEVKSLVEEFIGAENVKIDTTAKNALISTISGMTKETIHQVLRRNLNKYEKRWSSEVLTSAREEKERFVALSGVVDLIHLYENISNIGGLDNLKKWLRKKKRVFDRLSDARKLGIIPPKGVLLAGMPGCGKSLTAKATASLFQFPLLRLDIGSLMGKYVGESEANMKKALKIAEQVSPCVLWIDELEKAFAGLNGSGGGADVTSRLFGFFLTWMQEKPATVFVVATANNIIDLPPELLRKGRFDEIFFVDLPSAREREAIFTVHLKRLNQESNLIDCHELAQKTEGFSGADIQAILNSALEDIFIAGHNQLTNKTIETSIKGFIPVNEVLKDKIEQYRKLFEQFKLTPASLPDNEIDQLELDSKSDDPCQREEAAKSEHVSSDKLAFLARDRDKGVRNAVLENPNCPEAVLLDVIDRYPALPDFSRPLVWSDSLPSKNDFEHALFHPNLSRASVLDLFQAGKIPTDMLYQLIYKLSDEDKKSLFGKRVIKLPRAIKKGTVRAVHVEKNDPVTETTLAIELDDQDGITKEIAAAVSGVISEICITRGETVQAGDPLFKVLKIKRAAP